MVNILNLFLIQAKRQLLGTRHQSKMPLLVGILLIVFTGIQIGFIHDQRDAYVSVAGWLVSGFFMLYTIFGLISNRLPGNMEDIIWLYPLYPMPRIIHAVFVWRVVWKGAIWFGSASLADLIVWITKQTYGGLMGKACTVLILVAVHEYWVLAASCARTIRSVRAFYMILLLAIATAHGVLLYDGWRNGWHPVHSWMEQIGSILHGHMNPLWWLMVLLTGTISCATIYICGRDLRSKERLVVEADFWAEFQDHQAYMAKLGTKTKKTWWGLPGLQGVWSFLWIEMAITRKHLFAHILQLAGMVILLHYLIIAHLEWFYIVMGIITAAMVLGSYYSSLVRHAKSGDLFMLPGPLWKKTIILETANLIWIWLIFLYSFAVYAYNYPLSWANMSLIVLEGIGFYMLMLGIRWNALIQTYKRSPDMPIVLYYRYFFISLAGAGVVLAAVYWLLLGAASWKTAMVVCMLGLDRKSKRLNSSH